MEVGQPISLSQNIMQTRESDGPGADVRNDGLTLPPMLSESSRSKSSIGFSLPTPDDSPPRLEERKNSQSVRTGVPLLSLEETTELFRTKVQDARLDTQQLAGSEEVNEVVKPKLTLDLGNSNISRLPEAVVDLIKTEVERLSLSHNQIWHIPLRFSECLHLRYLNIRANVFRELPRGIYKLPLLEILDISRNKVRKIPKDIRHLTSLRVFSIVHNRIDDLPSEICEMTKLQIIKIAENPLRGKLKKVVESKDSELAYADVTDNEREQAITTEIKRFLREQLTITLPADSDAITSQDDIPMETPKPTKRVLSSRFPVVPSGSSMDASLDMSKSSPSQMKAPPIPTRSHYRVVSGQMNNVRKQNASSNTSQSERIRSNSDGSALQSNVNTRQRRMGMLRKEKSDLDAIDETKVFRQSHLRGFSHGSVLRRNGSISSPLVGNASPNSPRVYAGQMTPTMKRLSSLPEGRDSGGISVPIIEGAKGLLYSLHQIEIQIRSLIVVVGGSSPDKRRSTLEFTFYNASKWLKRLNKVLERAVAVDPEDTSMIEKALDSVHQCCADCVMAYKHVISQLQDNVKRIVAGVDPMYIRTLMLLLFGSIVEIKNAMKSFGVEMRGHKRQMSSGNTHSIETIPEEFTTPQQPLRVETPSGRSATRPQGGRYRSDTTIQLPALEAMGVLHPGNQTQIPGSARLPPTMHLSGSTLNGSTLNNAAVYPHNGNFTSFGIRSRSNSRTNFPSATNSSFSSVANTPHSGDGFSLSPQSHTSSRASHTNGILEAQEEAYFEQIYGALTKSYEIALQAIPLARKLFQRCLEAAEDNRQPKEIRELWLTLVHRCKLCQDNSEALQMRLTNMPHKDFGYSVTSGGNGRNDPSFWLLCKTFLTSFIELVTEMREAKELRLLPAEILVVLRPVQKASRDAGRLIEASPWRHLTDGVGSIPAPTPFSSHGGNPNLINNYSTSVNGGLSAYSNGLAQQLQHTIYNHQVTSGLPTPPSATSAVPSLQPPATMTNLISNGNSGNLPVQMPATPLSAALGPAAQATIPSTPASAYGDQFFKGDVFQRADSLLSMPQAGSVNFLNRR